MECRIIQFKQVDEDDGSLVFMEAQNEIPFSIKRIFYIFNTPINATRADHASKDTDFVLINIHGSTKISVDDAFEKKEYTLSSPNMGLYIPHNTWMNTFDFKDDSVLISLASMNYDKSHYFENYAEFSKYVMKKRHGK